MEFTKIRLIFVFVFIHTLSWAQVNRYMVFFKDKTGTPYSISSPEQFLTAKAIERRVEQNIVITVADLPVNPSYAEGISMTGAEVLYTTRWMNGALVQCDVTLLPAIEELEYVQSTELVAPGEKPVSNGRRRTTSRRTNSSIGTLTKVQLEMLGIDQMHEAGYRGEEMTIAIFDSGFQGVNATAPFAHLFSESRLNESVSFDFVHRQENVFQHDDHGTEVLSVIGAYQDGDFTGGAYKANFQLYVTEDVNSEYRIEEYNWLFAAERSDSLGVDIISTSLGYYDFDESSMNYSTTDMDGTTTVVTRSAQMAADRGMIVVTSAGNEGAKAWKIITAPADARDVLAVGAVNALGERTAISSQGPTADNRIKPDVAALGSGTAVIKSNGAPGSSSGTSLAAPLITSLVAGVWQRYPEMTNLEVLNALRESASQAANPDNFLGYGIPNFRAVVNRMEWKPQEEVFTVFPNPVLETVNIRPNNPEEITSCFLEVVSVRGDILTSKFVAFDWLNRTYTTQTSDMPVGVYILRIRHNNRIYTYKLVKL